MTYPRCPEWPGGSRGSFLFSHSIVRDEEAVPADQQGIAMMAARVLQFPDLAREVAGVHVFQSRLFSDLNDPQKIICRCLAMVHHLVVRMERSHVPRHERVDRGKKVGHAFEVIRRVAEAGDDEGDDLNPEAALLEHLDGAGDVVENAAQSR